MPANTNISRTENSEITVKNDKDDRKVKDSIDLSKWTIQNNEYITSESKNGDLVLTSKAGYYYVILSKDFETYNASTLLMVKNLEGKPSDLGYGLVIHSDPKSVLSKDYAFLIRNDTRQYRVVRHTDKKESIIVKWTRSSAIKS